MVRGDRVRNSRSWTLKVQGRGGFTLLELLVVVALLTLLAAVLLPALSRARTATNRSACLSNLHQLSLAFAMYLQDSNEQFPPNGVAYIDDLRQIDRLWFRQIQPYLKSTGILHCPADNIRNARRTLSAGLPEEQDQPGLPALSYGANWDLMNAAAQGRPEANVAALPYPEQTLLVADCTEPWAFGPVYADREGVRWSHIAYANGPPEYDPALMYSHGGRSGRGHERHGMGSYVGFIDGHAAFIRADQFYRSWRPARTSSTGQSPKRLVQWPIVSPKAIPLEDSEQSLEP